MSLPHPLNEGAAERAATGDLYRAVWRWHFYAGLLVLPFMIVLAITGALYLFHNEIEDAWYRDLRQVPVANGAPRAPEALAAIALASQPGGVLVKYLPPASPRASAQAVVRTPVGERLSIYADPYTGRILGSLPERGTLMWTIRRLHSLDYFGPVANALIEIAAGWSLLLVASGLYLWWPRGRRQGVITVRGGPGRRVFWRDLHAVTGLFTALFIVFLALTGLPWSQIWGAKVNQWANGSNFGYPAGVRVQLPMSDLKLADQGPTTWSLEQARLPRSGGGHEGHAGHDAGGPAHTHPAMPMGAPAAIGLDRAVAVFEHLGLAPGYAINLPDGPRGVYTASVYPNDLHQQRVVHLDQYSGKPLLDMRYADYGPLGRTLEWGINVHMGQEFGLANQIILALACLAIVLLSVSAAAMWWKRRPAGRLGIPPAPREARALRGVLAIMAIGGLIFPLVGLSLILMWLFDRLALRLAGARAS
ncbi:PepSY-associated TM helix domain-containing protein [Bordetella hinzii]|uniref:PepSY-associated TM helix domain-containing protein n=1 Tax=Bordetella hinzii TaxID=103855 RepID=UPI0039FD5DD3